MNASNLIAAIAAGLAVAASPAHALPAPFEFNGHGFEFTAGSFDGSTTIGPQALTIDRFADERGLGGSLYRVPVDYTDLGIELSLQIGPENQASDFQVRLIDDEGDMAIFNFPAGGFNTAGFTTLRLDDPSFFNGPFNAARVNMLWFSGDFGSTDTLDVRLDRIAAVAPVVEPPPAIPEPGALALAGAGLLGLAGTRRVTRRR